MHRFPALRPSSRWIVNPALGIGMIGAGRIVRDAHLPAYRKAGFSVRGLYDRDEARACELAAEYGLRTFHSVEELLEDETVAVVDIAVPGFAQPALARQVIAARRHLLCQKPLAEDFGEAQELVGLAEEAGVLLAVNQNSRWTAGIRHARHLIEEGWIGQPLIGQIECDAFIDWSMWGWLEQVPRLVLLYNTIHSIESMRSIFGMPHSVFALLGRDPEQRATGETVALLTFRFDSGLLFLVKENARNRSADQHARFRFEGTSGVIDGTLGIYSVPAFGTPDTLRLTTAGADFSFDAQFHEAWMPDAFISTMGELLAAITEHREPEHGGRGNLDLLRLVFAAYRSADAERPVTPQEIG